MNKKFLSLALAILAPFAYSETREKNGIFDCVFMDAGESQTLSGWGTAITSSTSWTTEQKGAVHRSLDTWMGLINNSAGRQLTALFSWSDNLGENVLGGSSSGYALSLSPPAAPFTYYLSPVEAVWKYGANWNAEGNFDIVIQFSSSFIDHFYFGETATIDQDQIDFQSVMTHELGHNMGFASISRSTTETTGGWMFADQEGKPILTAFDSLMTLNGKNPIENLGFELGSTIGLGSDGLTVYNPSSWGSGSSMSHIDPVSDPNALMNPSIRDGEVKRGLTAKELLLMQEMGWSINAAAGVPEPSSSVLFLLAGGVFLLRRNRKREQA